MSQQLAEALKEKQGDRSLRALARDLGVAVGTAEGWLKGWRAPKWEYVPTLANYLNIDVNELTQWEIEDAKNRVLVTDILGLTTHHFFAEVA